MKNRLKDETSPYLLQHAENPVNWYPWCKEAFEKAKIEDKPVFLSIGYSTCHWCHVMAHESFEDKEIAEILNKNFVSIKVDKEERPDIDSIYMGVCQALTGSGGWPTSIFMTFDQKPFFAGTYFPKEAHYGMIGFKELLNTIIKNWNENRENIIKSSAEITDYLKNNADIPPEDYEILIEKAKNQFKHSFDSVYGGFGNAPKFPTPHNLLFLMRLYQNTKDKDLLYMSEKTLTQMYKGGIYDHIGYGFSRYSTDKYFLVPHFEKMLYDNALLIIAYIKLYSITENDLYKEIAKNTADYVLRELSDEFGGFYCAQDADSEGVEGKYYVFSYNEIINVLGEEKGKDFNTYFGITKEGNFEGENIPNLLFNSKLNKNFKEEIQKLYDYRLSRTSLHKDKKILTSWNSLMIAALAFLYKYTGAEKYIDRALKAVSFIEENMYNGKYLYAGFSQKASKGFLDDYAFYIYALICLYDCVVDKKFIEKAIALTEKVYEEFYDEKDFGFYLYGKSGEQLILKPKETYDGAIPSGNSVMAYNLVRLYQITKDENIKLKAENQLEFISRYAKESPMNYSFYLYALLNDIYPMADIVCVLKDNENLSKLKNNDANIIVQKEDGNYKALNDKTTFYVCMDRKCFPPVNDIGEIRL